MTEKQVYEFYQEFVKPIYSEIEARWNDIPVELLFESYAAFDHLKRFHLGEESEDEASVKALSHLKRGVLDAFKLKLKYFNLDLDQFMNSKVDFQLIDNGEFISSLYKDKHDIIAVAKQARLAESQLGTSQAFEKWFDVSQKIDLFEQCYLQHSHKIDWAKGKTFAWLSKDMIKAFLIGLLSGGVSSYFIWWLTI